ncbi:heparan-alpha-glucosaminide N-acetyltransferase domain-containing protein [Billgrantia lactosivorans]|uniref:heparan-alpha-glucosaminide N-acetyltransferase domain-containing protein n=1 Tax=Billgrantia lactosivorans TaxID=2185141 RepID=UPI000DACDE8A|nr:heparan-alpha-glucosaminide N-acetyltransferase domain-containing protein [Halomonas lactosivorans]
MIRLSQKPQLPPLPARVDAIDLARGFAIALMILSHTVSGLLGIDQVPDWGMVPVHLITKFSSSLFILVFGIALAVAFLPKAGTPDWPGRRRKLMLRGIEVLFWYKALTVVEMLPMFTPQDIVATLLYQRFAIWVEILGFYALALLWLPWVLPLWRRLPLWSRLLAPVAVGASSVLLERHFHFWGSETLKALLVEDLDHYTWGQLARLPLVMMGLLIGEAVLRWYGEPSSRRRLVACLAGMGAACLAGFAALSMGEPYPALQAVAQNVGKHPPEVPFMLFSVGGALVIMALCLLGGRRAATWLKPITLIGGDALRAFIFHIVAIFLVLRLLFGAWQVYSYPQVLGIGLGLILLTSGWIVLMRRFRELSR